MWTGLIWRKNWLRARLKVHLMDVNKLFKIEFTKFSMKQVYKPEKKAILMLTLIHNEISIFYKSV